MQNANSENSETDLKRDCKEIIVVGGDAPVVMALFESIELANARAIASGDESMRDLIPRILCIELPKAISRAGVGIAVNPVRNWMPASHSASTTKFRSKRSRAGKQERWR